VSIWKKHPHLMKECIDACIKGVRYDFLNQDGQYFIYREASCGCCSETIEIDPTDYKIFIEEFIKELRKELSK